MLVGQKVLFYECGQSFGGGKNDGGGSRIEFTAIENCTLFMDD